MLGRWARHSIVAALLLLLVAAGWWQGQQMRAGYVWTSGPVDSQGVAILLFPSEESMNLKPVVVRLPVVAASGGGVISEVIGRLLAGPPAGLYLVNPFPAGTRLLGWQWVEPTQGVLRVNLSGELVAGHGGGTSGELATVYTLVDTLTLLPGVKAVELWVEGRPLDTLAGHLDLRGPLTSDLSLVDMVALRQARQALMNVRRAQLL
ncbi:MAG: GerMN domain-containing protein [Limnochordaceae bacterium]|nr:GerMN domain-containing protein [Limnochordaceae bacterium]